MASRAERPIIPSKKSLADAYMALKATLENKLSPYFEDYGQLIEPGSPLNNDYQNLKQRVSRHIPSNEDFRNPQSMSEWSQAAALNAPMGLMFAGPKSAGWNKQMAKKAQDMLDSGVAPAKVWKETLYGKMPDGNMFTEIPDNKAAIQGTNFLARSVDKDALAGGAPKSFPQWAWMTHDDLYKNYPDLKNIDVVPNANIGSPGSYDKTTNTIGLSAFADSPKSTSLHELQHAIQQREGWAKGGSPETSWGAVAGYEDLIQAKKEKLWELMRNGEVDKAKPLRKEITKMHENLDVVSTDPYKAYHRLTGEAQARATQGRMNMDMDARRASYPLAGDKLDDVSLSDLISIYGDGKAMSTSELPPTKYSKAHKIAQRNAALPVEQGGLGLPPDNTAMDRAEALGFDTDTTFYHGTNEKFDEFDTRFHGAGSNRGIGTDDGFFFATDKGHAKYWANQAYKNQGGGEKNVKELMLKIKNPLIADYKKHGQGRRWVSDRNDRFGGYEVPSGWMHENPIPDSIKKANIEGNDSVIFKNYGDEGNKGKADFVYLDEPKNIRSRLAAFDPMKKDSANILASTAGAGVVAKALSGDEAEAGDNMRNNVSDSLLHAVMMQESGGNPNAVSSKGARGLYQIMDATARNPGFGVEPLRNNSITDQKRFAKDYLGAMLERYDGNLPVSLAAYNAGPGAVDKAGGIPNYKETQGYVANVMNTANASQDVDTSGWIDVTDEPSEQGAVNQSLSVDEPDTSGWIDVTDEPTNVVQAPPVNGNSMMSPGQQDAFKTLGHKAQVAGRSMIEGVAGIPESIYNTAQIVPRYLQDKTGYQPPIDAPREIRTEQYGTALADKLGLDKATENDAMLAPIMKGVGGFALPAAGYSKIKSGAGIIGGVAKQLPGMMAGQGASEAVKQMGGGEGAQMAANVAGNVLGGWTGPTVAGVVTAGKRAATGGMGTGKGLEAVAGRLLNKAAGGNNIDAITALEKGTVPTIKRRIPGYSETTSQVAAVPGVSAVMDQIGLSPEGQTALKARKFDNAKAITKYAEKAAGTAERAQTISDNSWARVEKIAEPMRERNLPVDITPVKAKVDELINKYKGKTRLISTLTDFKNDLPKDDVVGFDEILNFKQELDETLRKPIYSDPKIASLKAAESKLADIKKSITDVMQNVEPDFKDYLKDQAIAMKQLKQRELGGLVVEKSKSNSPLTGWTDGVQENVNQVRGNSLATVLKEANGKPINKDVKELSKAQRRVLKTAQEHAQLAGREQMGSQVGSQTAQRLSIKDAVYRDLVEGGFGDKENIGSKGLIGLGGWAGSLPVVKNVTKAIGDANSEKLIGILTKAELNPKYAAQLMKTYGLGHMNFNDPAGRAALRGMMTNNRGQQ